MDETLFRKGFGLKRVIEGELAADYHSALVADLRARGSSLALEGLEVILAREFGFCYGVDRAVEYAYETRAKFPDRRLVLVGEIIHNPHVNRRLVDMGIDVLQRVPGSEFDFSHITSDEVVILPAFGVTKVDFDRLREVGCVIVDTTCGSVLNVWKRVESYARDGFTALVHGKYFHEETRATASQVTKYPGGRYLVVRDMGEARLVCDFIEGRVGAEALLDRFRGACSEGFTPARDLERVGVANQTTMLSSESLAIASEVRAAMVRRYGEAGAAERFRSFDTICSATQDRQDAVLRLLDEGLDLALVIGGYNSSNTNHLAALCAERVPTFHVADSECLDPDHGFIRHKPVGAGEEVATADWLPDARPLRVGVTAGASTPTNKVGELIERVFATAGIPAERVAAEASLAPA
jgi:4-hydroxy-3-methylbut-2-enyl diphosphate reductase